jgi:hypothetical protein
LENSVPVGRIAEYTVNQSRVDKPMSAGKTRKGRVNDTEELRGEWLSRLSELTGLVRSWAEHLDWSTRQIAKRRMKDSRLGLYEAPALIMQKGTTRVLLDPVARFAPGVDGVVDLYLKSAYDDIATFYLVDGQWRLHHVFPDTTPDAGDEHGKSTPLSQQSFSRVLEEMSAHASETL